MKKIIISLFIISLIIGCSSRRYNFQGLDDTEALRLAEELFEQKKYRDAAETFTFVYINFPYSYLKSYSLYMSARSYLEDKRYDEAISAFINFKNRFINDSLISNAKYYLALSYEKASLGYEKDQSKRKAALVEYMNFITQYPDNSHTEQAVLSINEIENTLLKKIIYEAEVYMRMHKDESALIVLKTAEILYPNAYNINKVYCYIVKLYLKFENFDKANEYLVKLTETENEYTEWAREKLFEIPINIE